MRFGVLAMTAFTLASILSIRPIRNMAYEIFLILHIILVAMYLIFGLFHVPGKFGHVSNADQYLIKRHPIN